MNLYHTWYIILPIFHITLATNITSELILCHQPIRDFSNWITLIYNISATILSNEKETLTIKYDFPSPSTNSTITNERKLRKRIMGKNFAWSCIIIHQKPTYRQGTCLIHDSQQRDTPRSTYEYYRTDLYPFGSCSTSCTCFVIPRLAVKFKFACYLKDTLCDMPSAQLFPLFTFLERIT